MNTKNAFHACDDCQNPGECAMVAATKQGMPCLPAVNAGQPLDIDQPLISEGRVGEIERKIKEAESNGMPSRFEEISRKLNEHNQGRAAALAPADQLAFEPVRVELAKMSLLPGDTLVVKMPSRLLSAELSARVRTLFQRAVPPAVEVLVIDERMELAILEKATVV